MDDTDLGIRTGASGDAGHKVGQPGRQRARPIGHAEEQAAAKFQHRPGRVCGKEAVTAQAARGHEARALAACRAHRPHARFPVAYHSPRDEGPLRPFQPSRHSFVVVVDREGEETWIVDPLHLQPAQDLAVRFQRAGFIVHAVQEP